MIMYTKKAIERLNNINWEDVGKNGEEKDIELGIEFIKKMAVFCKKNQIKPMLPFMTNLSSPEGDCVLNQEILDRCNYKVQEIIKKPSFSTSIVIFYLQASILADQNIKYVDCVNVYEPIIKLFEKGGCFVYRERGMSFLNSGLISLNNWFDKFSS